MRYATISSLVVIPGLSVCRPCHPPIKNTQLAIALDEIRVLLKREHEEDYLGIVFVDNLISPALVKIYDPCNLGSSCGSSGRQIPPGWILSRLPPLSPATFLCQTTVGAGGTDY
jgi:hypothetical protein